MNTNKEINPVLKSRLRERFFIFIVNNFSAGFLNMETKICSGCKIEKSVNVFYKDENHKDKLRSRCKKCISEDHKKDYKINKYKINERTKNWYKNNTKNPIK